MIKFYICLFIALAIILCFGMSTFGLIVGMGLLGAVGNGVIAAKRQADEEKNREELDRIANEEFHRRHFDENGNYKWK